MPSADPPPCPTWGSVPGSSVKVQLQGPTCFWGFYDEQKLINMVQCCPFFVLCLHCSALMFSKIDWKSFDHLPWVVLGWFWGLLGQTWETFWSQDGPKLKKGWKSDFVDPPHRDQVGSQNRRKIDLVPLFSVFFMFVFRALNFHRF